MDHITKIIGKSRLDSKQDAREPFLMPNRDKALIFIAISAPLTILSSSVFLRTDLYLPHALEVRPQSPSLSYNDVNFVRAFCWSNMHQAKFNDKVVDLSHYSTYPYVLIGIPMVLYVLKSMWRSKTFFQLSPYALDYVIDGLEEEIRDSIEQMVNIEDENNNEWSNKQQKMEGKYDKLKKVLRNLSQSSRFSNNVKCLRLLFLVIMSTATTLLYNTYLTDERNPTEFVCQIPTMNSSVPTIDVSLVYPTVRLRSTLLWALVYVYSACICFVIGLLMNIIAMDRHRHLSMNLLRFLFPDVEYGRGGDIEFIMDLVYLNKSRLKFIKLAFYILDASQLYGAADDAEEKKHFFEFFAEAIHWAHSDVNDDKISKIVSKLVNNTMRINEGRIILNK